MCLTTEACATPGGVYTLQSTPERHLDVSAQQRHVLLLEESTPLGSELHLDMSALQRHVLHRQISSPQRPDLQLDVSTIQRPVLLLDVSRVTPQGLELHLDFLLQRPVLHLDLSSPRGLSCTWTWSDNRSLVCAAAGLVYTAEACAASGHVYTLGPELHLDVSYPQVTVPNY
jgi:hypothetical protein